MMRKSDYGTDFAACVFIFAHARHVLFVYLKMRIFMPRNQFQRTVFAFITVVITVHAYVFYSI